MSARSRLIRLCSATVVSAFIAGAAMLTAPTAFAADGHTSTAEPVVEAVQSVEPTTPVEPEEAEPGAPEATEPVAPNDPPAPVPTDPGVEEDVTQTHQENDWAKPGSIAPQVIDQSDVKSATQATLEATIAITPRQTLTVKVQAEGLPTDITGAYAALIEEGTEAILEDASQEPPAFALPFPVVTVGSSAFELVAPIKALDRSKNYEVIVWQQHAAATADSIYVRQVVDISATQWADLFGDPKPETKPVTDIGSLNWGVLDSFIKYVEEGAANGEVTTLAPAKRTGSTFDFVQVKGGSWNSDGITGILHYGGGIQFTGHQGALDLTITNPTVKVESGAKTATLSVDYDSVDLVTGKWTKGSEVVATLDLTKAKRSITKGNALRWANAPATLTEAGVMVFQDFYEAGKSLAPVTFVAGIASEEKPVEPTKPNPGMKPKPKPVPKPLKPSITANGAKAAGSLSWGVSTAFADYVTGPIAKGSVSTSGVGSSGGAYLFPQASGGSWNSTTQTGSVQYSGTVTYTGHHGLLREGVSNPMIQVTGPTTAVLYSGGAQWATLDLGAATKSVGSNGEVTWSGVPVNGGFSGGAGGGSSYTLPADGLSFTVGAASGVSYGSTSVTNADKKRTAADTAPTTTGIRILTAADQITAGAELEFEAEGFEAGEREMIVALYPGPVVLDEAAGANDAGTVRWLGTLPDNIESGEYTITVQGSIDAGAVFTVLDADKVNAEKKKQQKTPAKAELAQGVQADVATAAGIGPAGTGPEWLWWVGAGALLIIAAAMGGLVALQRRGGQ